MKLEVVVIPVSDVDRAKRFYGEPGVAAGRRFRHRQRLAGGAVDAARLAVLDPLRQRTSRRPRRARLRDFTSWSSDIEAARAELIGRGAEVSEVFHFDAGPVQRTAPAVARGPATRTRQFLPLVRHIQRSRRQRLAAPGDQDASSRTRTQQRTSRR